MFFVFSSAHLLYQSVTDKFDFTMYVLHGFECKITGVVGFPDLEIQSP